MDTVFSFVSLRCLTINADYKKVLEIDPSNPEALRASVDLPPKIQEQNEKLKEEMMGKV